MKEIRLKLTSTNPLLMNHFTFGASENVRPNDVPLQTQEDLLRISEPKTYRDADGNLIVPADNLFRSMISGGAYIKVGKASLGKKVASGITLGSALTLTLNKKPLQKYEVSIMKGVNPSTRGVVALIRPLIPKWEAVITVIYNNDILTEAQVLDVIAKAGQLVGIGDFRPEKKGTYGTFAVEKL